MTFRRSFIISGNFVDQDDHESFAFELLSLLLLNCWHCQELLYYFFDWRWIKINPKRLRIKMYSFLKAFLVLIRRPCFSHSFLSASLPEWTPSNPAGYHAVCFSYWIQLHPNFCARGPRQHFLLFPFAPPLFTAACGREGARIAQSCTRRRSSSKKCQKYNSFQTFNENRSVFGLKQVVTANIEFYVNNPTASKMQEEADFCTKQSRVDIFHIFVNYFSKFIISFHQENPTTAQTGCCKLCPIQNS